MAYQILHFLENRCDYIARVDDLDEVHQWFTNIRVVYGGYVNTAELELCTPKGLYRAQRV